MQLFTDVILIALAIGVIVHGARRGVIAAAASAVGIVGGIWIGIVVAPGIVAAASSVWAQTLPQVFAVTIVAIAVAMLCAVVCTALARGLRRLVTRIPGGRLVDTTAGGLFGLATWALVVWLVAGLAASTGMSALIQVTQSSNVVSTLNRVVPLSVGEVFGTVDDAFAAAGLPEVFSGVEAPIVAVGDPPASTPAAVADASSSVVLVTAQKMSCGIVSTGSGWPMNSTEIVTNAHVVAGASTVTVTDPRTSRNFEANVVYYDPELDIAVLRVPDLNADALTVDDEAAAPGDDVYAVGYPGGGPLTITPGRVRSVVQAVGLDIYNTTPVTRQVYSLRAEIRAGDSGGPLLNSAGDVVGVVFARSTTDTETGYALTSAQVNTALETADVAVAAVSTGACSSS